MKPSDIPGASGKRETFEVMLQLEHEREAIKIQQEHEKELAKMELKTAQATRPQILSVNITVTSTDMARIPFNVIVTVVLILIYKKAKSLYQRKKGGASNG